VEVDKWLVANSDQSITIRPSPWRRPARVPGGGGSAATICECAWQWLFLSGGGYEGCRTAEREYRT
jgi:hypothetical protein